MKARISQKLRKNFIVHFAHVNAGHLSILSSFEG